MKILFMLLLSATAFSSSINITSVNQSQSFLKKVMPTRISYFSAFSGPSLSEEARADENGDFKGGNINTWNQVSFGWKINDRFRFVVNPRFSLNHNSSKKDYFEFLNPVFGVSATWYKRGDLTIGGGVNTILPAFRTASTIDSGLILNPGGFQYLNYDLTSKISLGTWLNARAKFYEGSDDNEDRNRLNVIVNPLVTYNFSDKVSSTLFYEITGQRNKSNPLVVKGDSDNFGLIGSFTIGKALTLQPMVVMYRSNGLDIKRANFNMWLSGRLF